MAGSRARPRMTTALTCTYVGFVPSPINPSVNNHRNMHSVTHIPVRRPPGQICCRISVKYHRPAQDRRSHSQSDINSTRTSPHRTEFRMDDNYDFESAGEYHTLTPFKTQPKEKTSYSIISSLQR